MAACVTPAVYAPGFPFPGNLGDKEDPARLGIVALLLGWLTIPSGEIPSCIPWSANWFLFVGWGCLLANRFGIAAWLGAVATVLALATWVTGVPDLLVGYYLWHGSMVVLMAGTIVLSVTTIWGDDRLPQKLLDRSGG